MKTRLIVGHKAHPGMVRENMEDAYSFRAQSPDADMRRKGWLFVVADGVGGYQAGEVASNMAVSAIMDNFYKSSEEDRKEALRHSIVDANTSIFQYAQAANYKKMSTTVVCAVFVENCLLVAHAGDSRAYLYRRGRMQQLTEDHSWVNEQVRLNRLTAEEAAVHPSRNIITRSLGNHPVVEPELEEGLDLEDCDRILLCTDGLYDLVSQQEMLAVLESSTVQEACDELVDMANRAGGSDNITALVVEFRTETSGEKTDPAREDITARWAAASFLSEPPRHSEGRVTALSVNDPVKRWPAYQSEETPAKRDAPQEPLPAEPPDEGDLSEVKTAEKTPRWPIMIQSESPKQQYIRQWSFSFFYSIKEEKRFQQAEQQVTLPSEQNVTAGIVIPDDGYDQEHPVEFDLWVEVNGRKSSCRVMGGGVIARGQLPPGGEDFGQIIVIKGNEYIPFFEDNPLIFVRIKNCRFALPDEGGVKYANTAIESIEFHIFIQLALEEGINGKA